MNLKDQMNGVQHVGVPTNDIETTIKFYEALGFEIAFQTVNEAANEKVAFLKLGNLVIETYENKAAKLESGAIDHVAIDVKDVEKVHEMVTAVGLNTTNDEVHFLPFWENGVKFFTIEGPNKEKSVVIFLLLRFSSAADEESTSCASHNYNTDDSSLHRKNRYSKSNSYSI